MRLQLCIASLLLMVASVSASADQFTPVIASTLTQDARPVPGTDGRWHFVYELVVTNTRPTLATLNKISVVDGSHESSVLASYERTELISRLRTMAGTPVKDASIPYNESRLFLINFAVDAMYRVLDPRIRGARVG